MTDPVLRALVDLRDRQIQKARIQFGNRLAALDNASDNGTSSKQRQVVERWLEVFKALEEQLDRDITEAVKDVLIFEELEGIKGIGPLLAAKMLSMIDIEQAGTVSALWRYSGYGVGKYWTNGDGKVKAPLNGLVYDKDKSERVRVTPEPEPDWTLEEMRDRPVEGYLLSYNKRLKTTLYLVASSFMKCGSPYRQIYDQAKVKYEQTTDWPKGHIHRAATRKMIKIFLSHLWERWRLAEGLPIRRAYVLDELGHEMEYTPQEFGWGK